MKPKSTTIRGSREFGDHVQLSVAVADDAGGRWNVLAYESDLKGRGTRLTRADFVTILGNYARYPKVPITIEHADTNDGPTEWAKPHGWITELRIGSMERKGNAVATLDGKMVLDAATRPEVTSDPPTWPFGSVTIVPNARDDETNEELGALLWSFSLTAHPALSDVPRLVASRQDSQEAQLPLSGVESAEDLERSKGIAHGDLTDQLRAALAMPDADADAIIARVRAMIERAPRVSVTDTNKTLSRGGAARERTMPTYLELAASHGLAAANEEDARGKILALAAEGPEVRKALNLSLTASSAEVAAKLTSALADAAKVPALAVELTAFRTERDARQASDRTAHIDAVMLSRHLPAEMKPSLEFHARSDWQGFQQAFPLPTQAELAERARDAARLSRPLGRPRGSAPANVGAGPGANDILAGVNALINDAAAKGLRLTFSEAVEMLEANTAPIVDDGGDAGMDAAE